jgi:hypothetical protein
MYDVFIAQSATAFMQGLYPPLRESLPSNETFPNSQSTLATGQNVEAPLGNYQYPDMFTTYESDPNYIYLAGSTGCPTWTAAQATYEQSNATLQMAVALKSFYERLYNPVFQGVVSPATLNYSNAYEIWDFLSYGYIHNETINSLVSADDLNQARYLADGVAWTLNGDTSTSTMATIAGRTLAYEVLARLLDNYYAAGVQSKISLLFTSFEPMMALASLLGVANTYTEFKGMPDLGSSMAFELFSLTNASATSNGTNLAYPIIQDLNVRFLFRNGTNSTTNLNLFPIFGNTETQMSMPFQSFFSSMEEAMVSEPGVWCSLCGSSNAFCPGYEQGIILQNSTTSSGSGSQAPVPTVQKPYLAGIIGGIIALALVAILLVLAMLFGGIRFYRQTDKRASHPGGGFKGAEKLSSDVDLPSKGNAVVGASVIGASVVGKETGHRRVESWELREGRSRPSFDAHADTASIFQQEPAKTDERV